MEIEHKYLVLDDSFRHLATQVYHIEQGYISVQPTVRVRIRDEEAFLTIKGPKDPTGLMCSEYEYTIPLAHARELMKLCSGRTLTKERYLVPYQGFTWEVDVFFGRHEGLILAELEVPSTETLFPIPDFIGREVTGERRYHNASLAMGSIDTPQA